MQCTVSTSGMSLVYGKYVGYVLGVHAGPRPPRAVTPRGRGTETENGESEDRPPCPHRARRLLLPLPLSLPPSLSRGRDAGDGRTASPQRAATAAATGELRFGAGGSPGIPRGAAGPTSLSLSPEPLRWRGGAGREGARYPQPRDFRC